MENGRIGLEIAKQDAELEAMKAAEMQRMGGIEKRQERASKIRFMESLLQTAFSFDFQTIGVPGEHSKFRGEIQSFLMERMQELLEEK